MLQGFIDRLLSWKSTAVAIVTSLLTVMAAVNVINADVLTDGIAAFAEVYDLVLTGLGLVITVWQLFKKDEEEVETVKRALGIK